MRDRKISKTFNSIKCHVKLEAYNMGIVPTCEGSLSEVKVLCEMHASFKNYVEWNIETK